MPRTPRHTTHASHPLPLTRIKAQGTAHHATPHTPHTVCPHTYTSRIWQLLLVHPSSLLCGQPPSPQYGGRLAPSMTAALAPNMAATLPNVAATRP
eukprot:6230264-Prymnesium_polylepis.1